MRSPPLLGPTALTDAPLRARRRPFAWACTLACAVFGTASVAGAQPVGPAPERPTSATATDPAAVPPYQPPPMAVAPLPVREPPAAHAPQLPAGALSVGGAAAPEPTRGQNNVHGLGFSASYSSGSGFTYRRYFGDTAVQFAGLAVIQNRGDDAWILAGIGATQYLLVWHQPNSRGLLPAVTALRLTGGTSVFHDATSTQNFVPVKEACADPFDLVACPVDAVPTTTKQTMANLGVGIGFEFGGVMRSGFSLSLDLLLTAAFKLTATDSRRGLAFIYPLPQMALIYNW